MKPLYFRTPWPLTQRRLARVAFIEIGEVDISDRRLKRREAKHILKEHVNALCLVLGGEATQKPH